MTRKSRSVMLALGAAVLLGAAPSFAQNDSSGGQAYAAGVYHGRTLHDPRQCTGRGDYRQGCLDGVEESQFDREADQAMDSATGDTGPARHMPSPPPVPPSKPSDGQPPNN